MHRRGGNMRFVDEYGIDKMYNELQNYMNTFTRDSQVYDGITISAMHDPSITNIKLLIV